MNDFDYAVGKIAEAVRVGLGTPTPFDDDVEELLRDLSGSLRHLADVEELLRDLAGSLRHLASEAHTANKLTLIEMVLDKSTHQPKIRAARHARAKLLADYDILQDS